MTKTKADVVSIVVKRNSDYSTSNESHVVWKDTVRVEVEFRTDTLSGKFTIPPHRNDELSINAVGSLIEDLLLNGVTVNHGKD